MKWILEPTDFPKDKYLKLKNRFNISKPILDILIKRGYDTVEKINDFFDSSIDKLHNPFLLPNIIPALARIKKAIQNQEKTIIFGDRDVDGTTSTALVYRVLSYLKLPVEYKIPSGKDGYGLNTDIIEYARDNNITLIFTVDCGISNFDEIKLAQKYDIDVILTDHHEPPENLPPTDYIVNPKIKDSIYPCKELAGVGVAFKFMQALMLSFEKWYNQEMVVIDFETTGKKLSSKCVVEIGAVKIKNFVEMDVFETLVYTTQKILPNISEKTGIYDNDLIGAPTINDIADKLKNFLGNAIIVCHNKSFDYTLLKKIYKEIFNEKFNNNCIDTLKISRMMYRNIPHNLSAMAEYLNIKSDSKDFHRALYDTKITVELAMKMLFKKAVRYATFTNKNLDLVALGTVADMVPLTDENRILVKNGLNTFSKSKKRGIKELFDMLLTPKELKNITANKISFLISPILNSAGRLGKAGITAELFINSDKKRVKQILNELMALNSQRKKLMFDGMKELDAASKKQINPEKELLLFVVLENVKHGVTGILASKLMNEYYRPAIVLIRDKKGLLGAGRSIREFDLLAAITHFKDYLEKHGGHKQAVGLTVKPDCLDRIRSELIKYSNQKLKDITLEPTIDIDSEIDIDDINFKFIDQLDLLEPFGFGNPKPKFILKNVEPIELRGVGNDETHLRIGIKNKHGNHYGIGFSLANKINFDSNSKYNIVFCLDRAFFLSKPKIEIKLEDIKTL